MTYISLRCRGGILQKSRGRGIRHTCSFYSKCKQDCIETMMVLADPKSTFNPHPHLHTYIRTHAHLILLYTQRCAPLLLLYIHSFVPISALARAVPLPTLVPPRGWSTCLLPALKLQVRRTVWNGTKSTERKFLRKAGRKTTPHMTRLSKKTSHF